MHDDYEDYPDEGIFDPIWMAKYGLYHAIHNAPMNVLSGVFRMLDYMAEEDEGTTLDAETAVDILVRYALAGWHPRDLSESQRAEMEGREDRTVNPHRFSPEEINEEIERLRQQLEDE